jgi:hypothetical protein
VFLFGSQRSNSIHNLTNAIRGTMGWQMVHHSNLPGSVVPARMIQSREPDNLRHPGTEITIATKAIQSLQSRHGGLLQDILCLRTTSQNPGRQAPQISAQRSKAADKLVWT